MIKDCIQKLKQKQDLSSQEIEGAMQEIMSGRVEKDDMAQFLLALRSKGATIEEITGAAKIMREFVVRIEINKEVVFDTCGTGGDRSGTFNISTIVAFVVAGTGVTVAKHGNRSVSSCCGSADILEALGVNINLEASRIRSCLEDIGIAFLFAQRLHPAMKYAAPVRKELGVETIFNILGPLTNPALATHQMMGVYSKDLVTPLAYVLKNLGLKRALVVHGSDGLDEVTTTGLTFASEFKDGMVNSFTINPQDYGIRIANLKDLQSGSLSKNIQVFKDVLNGYLGPQRDIVILNAACALYTADMAKDIKEGIRLAEQSIDSKASLKKLEQLIEYSKVNSDFLSEVIIQKQLELKKEKKLFSTFRLKFKSPKIQSLRQFKEEIAKPNKLNLIAEIKKVSPSRGVLVKNFDPIKIAKIYQDCQADALSIITEERFFLGQLSFINEVKQNIRLPILRKDFIIDKYQIYESFIAGADAILLISELLSLKKLIDFLNLAKKLELDCLVEVHSQEDLDKTLDSPAEIIGVNNRNLHDFSVDLNVSKNLIPLIPNDKVKVCESGIKTNDDISMLKDLGVNAVLIGEAFLESEYISSKVKELFP